MGSSGWATTLIFLMRSVFLEHSCVGHSNSCFNQYQVESETRKRGTIVNIELGIVDHLWDASVHPNQNDIVVNATSPRGLNNGWYRAVIGHDGTIIDEKRMEPSGNYDPKPATNRPNMRNIIATIPAEYIEVIHVLKEAYCPETNGRIIS
jgi:hypothetical protein